MVECSVFFPQVCTVENSSTIKTDKNIHKSQKTNSESDFKDLVGYTDDPIVSSDVIGREETMVFDAKATMITADQLLKTLCWYDNGWGFASRILDVVDAYAALEAK